MARVSVHKYRVDADLPEGFNLSRSVFLKDRENRDLIIFETAKDLLCGGFGSFFEYNDENELVEWGVVSNICNNVGAIETTHYKIADTFQPINHS